MKKISFIFILFCFILFYTIGVNASECGNGVLETSNCVTGITCTWTGSVNNKASEAGNWSCGHVPNDGDAINIDNTADAIDWDYPIRTQYLTLTQNFMGKLITNNNIHLVSQDCFPPLEQCDDGNDNDYDGCTNTCEWEYCGDGIAQHWLDEECDDGNNNELDKCSNSCQRKYNCVDGKECWVVYDPNSYWGICNVDKYGNPDPRIDRTYPITDGKISYVFSHMWYTENVRLILCPGKWYTSDDNWWDYVAFKDSDIVGYDPPFIPHVSWQYQDLYWQYHDPSFTVFSPLDTVIKPDSPNQNAMTLRLGGYSARTFDLNMYIAGIVFQNATGTACVDVNDSTPDDCQPAAGVRGYCIRDVFLENNVFRFNEIGSLVKDTDPNWDFNFRYRHNLFTSNNIDGLRWHYGNNNAAWYNLFGYNENSNMRIRDGKYHTVLKNTFYKQFKHQLRLEAMNYPPSEANYGTWIQDNNFIGYLTGYSSFSDSCPSCGHWQGNYYKHGNGIENPSLWLDNEFQWLWWWMDVWNC